jgi:putative DNA primase/helicase
MVGLREGNEHPAVESHLSKYRRLMPALALILHLADGGVGPVSKKAALMAVSWCELLESHARRIYACVESERMRVAGILLGKIRQGALPATFSARDVIRKGWTALSTPDDVREAMAILIDHGWIREDLDTQTGGRPKLTYLVHPSLSSVLSVPQGGRLGHFDDASGREEE